jgi:thiamine pyrophosphokinase
MKQQSRVLLICNGEPPSRLLVRRLVRHIGTIVAADGGANAARRLGLRPDIIVGDMDSITPATRRAFASAEFVRVNRQDNTDLEKALDLLAERRVKDVVLIGSAGRRVDFTLGNFSVLWRYALCMKITVLGEHWRAMMAGKLMRIVSPPGTTLSLIPFGRVRGITLTGLQYPLVNGSLNTGHAAVSNVVVSSPCLVRVREGRLPYRRAG